MKVTTHLGQNSQVRANLPSVSHRCHLFEVAFVWKMTEETINLPLGCLQGGVKVVAVLDRDAALTRLPPGGSSLVLQGYLAHKKARPP